MFPTHRARIARSRRLLRRDISTCNFDLPEGWMFHNENKTREASDLVSSRCHLKRQYSAYGDKAVRINHRWFMSWHYNSVTMIEPDPAVAQMTERRPV